MSTPRLRPIVNAGDRFGRLCVVSSEFRDGKETKVDCVCDCGRKRSVVTRNLQRGYSASCGKCKRKGRPTHNLSRTREYRIWRGVKARCLNPHVKAFGNYGGRGIKICDRWLNFVNFYADMGSRPSARHQIERIDVNGNYEPGNCKWIPSAEQAQNKRASVHISIGEETFCISEWSRRTGVPASLISARIRNLGWCPVKAVLTPVRVNHKAVA